MDEIINNISNINVYDSSLFHFDDVNKKYREYLSKLLILDPNKLKYFILNLKNRELTNNQETEFQDSFLIELSQLSQKTDSISVTMKYLNDGDISREEIKKIHKIVIKGSSDDLEKNYNYRNDNNKWVGYFDKNGSACVDYIPPDFNELENLIDSVLQYLNSANDNFDNIFLKPLIVHALIAYLQPFGNGNTRLARVIQHCKICKLTNEKYNTNFITPTIYLSKNYLLTRSQYRGLIKDICIKRDNDAWNRWFNYNLDMLDEQLYFLNNNLDQYKMY